jgi:phage protein U
MPKTPNPNVKTQMPNEGQNLNAKVKTESTGADDEHIALSVVSFPRKRESREEAEKVAPRWRFSRKGYAVARTADQLKRTRLVNLEV